VLYTQAEVEERRERQERQEMLEKKKRKEEQLRQKEEAARVCFTMFIGDSVAQWLASWLATQELVSSVFIADALQLPSEA